MFRPGLVEGRFDGVGDWVERGGARLELTTRCGTPSSSGAVSWAELFVLFGPGLL